MELICTNGKRDSGTKFTRPEFCVLLWTDRDRFARIKTVHNFLLPSVPFPWFLAVHHLSLAFRVRFYHAKNEAPEEQAGLYKTVQIKEAYNNNIDYYYIDTSVLLENMPPVKFIKTTSRAPVVYLP